MAAVALDIQYMCSSSLMPNVTVVVTVVYNNFNVQIYVIILADDYITKQMIDRSKYGH